MTLSWRAVSGQFLEAAIEVFARSGNLIQTEAAKALPWDQMASLQHGSGLKLEVTVSGREWRTNTLKTSSVTFTVKGDRGQKHLFGTASCYLFLPGRLDLRL